MVAAATSLQSASCNGDAFNFQDGERRVWICATTYFSFCTAHFKNSDPITAGHQCATRDALVELSVAETGPRLWRSPLTGGGRAEIPVPDAGHGELGSVGTFLGCTEDAMFITSPDRPPDAEGAALSRWDGNEWSSQSVGGPGTLARSRQRRLGSTSV